MEKAKVKKTRKHLSIVLIPHSLDRIKTFSFTALYTKLIAVAVVFIAVVAYILVSYLFTMDENQKLREDISVLTKSNLEQEGLIREKADEIDTLKAKEEDTSRKVQDFMDKYTQLADTYVKDRSSSRISRGGIPDRTFINGLQDLKGLLDKLDDAKDTEDKSTSILSDTEAKLKKYMETVPTLWPTQGKISSNFGGRRDPFQSRSKFHEGIDISADYGQSIRASADGTVTYSGYTQGYGYNVIIDHGKGISTLYGHASKLLVKSGQSVKKGTIIARVGSSGRSTGPHLHFEICINGSPVDPLKYIEDK